MARPAAMTAPRSVTSSPHWTSRALSVFFACAGLFVLLCLLVYQPASAPLLSSHPQPPATNLGGAVGLWVGMSGRAGFGWGAVVLPVLCWLWSWRLWRGGMPEFHVLPLAMACLGLIASVATLLAVTQPGQSAQVKFGGLVGYLLVRSGEYYLGVVGTILTAGCVGVLAWFVVSGHAIRAGGWGVLRRVGYGVSRCLRWPIRRSPVALAGAAGPSVADVEEVRLSRLAESQAGTARQRVRSGPTPMSDSALDQGDGSMSTTAVPPRVRIRSTIEPKPKQIPTPPRRQAPGGFQLPPLDVFTTPPPISQRQITDDLHANSRVLEETLREFGIEATVVNVDRGPTVTRYELTPAPGVKLTKIVSLADDLALVLKAANCHVIAPIPGKGRVGVDVPNSTTTVVYLKEIITAHEFAGNPSPLVLPIGKDVSGHAIVADLRDCPHLLIAGATGSGKTVCLNSLMAGMLCHASPDQLKFLMIDPKMVEMAMFNEIPHLVAPVVNHAKKASVALHWAVEEMEHRYELLAAAGVRHIDMYNKRIASGAVRPTPPMDQAEDESTATEELKPLPYIVIVVDELADLMMVASQDVESAIARLAQLSRAVGIHMILATQRPSVDVITGVIKANFPARIAFQVASKVDSRTILDMNGADKLVGRGDLLFLPPGSPKPVRVQGAYVSDQEIERLTQFLKQQRAPAYDEQLLERARQPEGAHITADKDELYEAAKQLILDTGQASTSLLQRRLRLGYGRAARILDLMEQEGLVGPPQGSRPRDVLVARDQRVS